MFFTGDMYEARRLMLGLDEPPVTAEIPETYNMNFSPLCELGK